MIKQIVVHCSASPMGRMDDASDIHLWHKERGWSGIGYHYVILESGEIQAGRPEFWQGAHVGGYNAESLGICLIGMGGDATEKQLAALRQLIGGLKHKYESATVCGHCDLDKKKPDCPGFNVKKWWKGL